MSVELIARAKRTRLDGDSTTKLVLIVLADYANAEGMAWPSVDTLTSEVEKSERTVQNSLRKLERLGLIRRGDQSYARRYRADRRPVVYEMLPNGAQPTAPREPHDEVQPIAPRMTIHGAQSVAPRQSHGVQYSDATGCSPATERGAAHCTQTVIEPPIEPRETRARGKSTLQPIGAWVPDGTLRALARSLGLDCDLEFEKFHDSCLSTDRTSADWPASYRNWLRRGRELGLDKLHAKPTPVPDAHVRPPHRHTPGCEHVTTLIHPHEWRLSAENVDGFGTSPLLKAKQALADRLNQGMDPSAALADMGLTDSDELEDVA